MAIREALWLRVVPEPNTGCWFWLGEVTPAGYGRLRRDFGSRKEMAHRYFYEELAGGIPEGLQLDHLCRVTSCVNPEHLEPVTAQENMRRTVRPYCKYGHLKDPSYRHDCRECAKARARQQRLKNKTA